MKTKSCVFESLFKVQKNGIFLWNIFFHFQDSRFCIMQIRKVTPSLKNTASIFPQVFFIHDVTTFLICIIQKRQYLEKEKIYSKKNTSFRGIFFHVMYTFKFKDLLCKKVVCFVAELIQLITNKFGCIFKKS